MRKERGGKIMRNNARKRLNDIYNRMCEGEKVRKIEKVRK